MFLKNLIDSLKINWQYSINIIIAGRKVFRDFLKCEYSEENIMFWLACEELKKESDMDRIEERARLIYDDFISILSPREVCITISHFLYNWSYVAMIHKLFSFCSTI